MSESGQTPQTRSTSTSVVYRHVTLQDGAQLQVHEDKSVFVALEEPPPIRTIVQLWRGDEARAVVVDRVIEVPDAEAGEVRGFFGVPADDAAIVSATRVGTEGLGPAAHADDHGSGTAGGSDPGESNINMAMPAPVVVHDDADDEAAEPPAEATAAPTEATPTEAASTEATSADDPSSDAKPSSEAAPSGKRKRKGRGKKRK